MKFTRQATATWKGTGMEGTGVLSTQSAVLNNTAYSFHTRFKDEKGTNPEELIGAAHAGCFAMQLSFLITETGRTPKELTTRAKVYFEDGSITRITLYLNGEVPGMSEKDFRELAQKAKEICPVSKLLNTLIELEITYVIA
jgi:osmotically inducible protein OsmC